MQQKLLFSSSCSSGNGDDDPTIATHIVSTTRLGAGVPASVSTIFATRAEALLTMPSSPDLTPSGDSPPDDQRPQAAEDLELWWKQLSSRSLNNIRPEAQVDPVAESSEGKALPEALQVQFEQAAAKKVDLAWQCVCDVCVRRSWSEQLFFARARMHGYIAVFRILKCISGDSKMYTPGQQVERPAGSIGSG